MVPDHLPSVGQAAVILLVRGARSHARASRLTLTLTWRSDHLALVAVVAFLCCRRCSTADLHDLRMPPDCIPGVLDLARWQILQRTSRCARKCSK